VQSKIADDKATLTTRSGKKVGTVSFDEAAAQGEVSVDGVDGSFRVSRAGGSNCQMLWMTA
jgi:hypothetical protein